MHYQFLNLTKLGFVPQKLTNIATKMAERCLLELVDTITKSFVARFIQNFIYYICVCRHHKSFLMNAHQVDQQHYATKSVKSL